MKEYLPRLEEKISRCLTHLKNRELEKVREENPWSSLLDHFHVSDNSPEEFAFTLVQVTESDDLDSAASVLAEIDWDAALVKECQILLVAIFMDLEDGNINALCKDMRNLIRHSTRLAEKKPIQFDRLCSAVIALSDDDFWRFEIVSRAALFHLNSGNTESAQQWLRHLPTGDPGVFEQKLVYLRTALGLNDCPSRKVHPGDNEGEDEN